LELTRERWYIMRLQSPIRFYWDVFILIFAVYNSVTLPLQFAFTEIADMF